MNNSPEETLDSLSSGCRVQILPLASREKMGEKEQP